MDLSMSVWYVIDKQAKNLVEEMGNMVVGAALNRAFRFCNRE